MALAPSAAWAVSVQPGCDTHGYRALGIFVCSWQLRDERVWGCWSMEGATGATHMRCRCLADW